jgi:hypothetical protein
MMFATAFTVYLLVIASATGNGEVTINVGAGWKPHVVRQTNGADAPIEIPSKFQIVTESWNRVVAVPYIVYMPDKKRILMLVGCDYPHHAMVLASDDEGATWTEPKPIRLDAEGKIIPGLGTSLTYLGDGNLLLVTDRLWFSRDYGETWGGSDGGIEPLSIPPISDGRTWNQWDPFLVEKDVDGKLTRLVQTGYGMNYEMYTSDKGPGYSTGYLRFSTDEGRTWSDAIAPPQWAGVSEVALVRAKNGDMVAACRTDIPAHFEGETLDHYEGLGVSISKDGGNTWSDLNRLYDYGRHHPCLLLMPDGVLVMTYVVRKGYVDAADGLPQFGIEAIISRDHGLTWDLDHKYILHAWVGNRTGPESWWASSQATSSVLMPDNSILTAFGTGYRSQPAEGGPSPRDAGLVCWRLNDNPVNTDQTITNAPYDSELRNIFDPGLTSKK